MNTETTQARVSGTLDPIVGRYGHCMDCDNWTPLKKSRDRATYGQCSEYDERTSFDSSCNRRFVQANAEGQGCRASRHTLDPLVGSLDSET